MNELGLIMALADSLFTGVIAVSVAVLAVKK